MGCYGLSPISTRAAMHIYVLHCSQFFPMISNAPVTVTVVYTQTPRVISVFVGYMAGTVKPRGLCLYFILNRPCQTTLQTAAVTLGEETGALPSHAMLFEG